MRAAGIWPSWRVAAQRACQLPRGRGGRAAGEGLAAAFADIESLAERCRFKNCTHTNEPGCAVRAAIERGELSEERLSSYEKLRKENAYSEDAAGYLAAKEEKFRKIAKINKTHHKN